MSSPFDLDGRRVDIAITILRTKGVEVTIFAVPRANKPLEGVFEVLDGAPIKLLAVSCIEVEAHFEFEGVLIHHRLVYQN